MKVHRAVVALERTVTDAQSAIAARFDGDISQAQLRVELEGLWHVVKLIASAIDDEGVAVRDPLDLPTRAEIDAMVQQAVDRAASDTAPEPKRRRK